MGIFYEQTTVVNRAPITINVRHDGQDMPVPPGESQLATIAIDKGKNQNPIMGSCDPNNPSLSGGQYLLAIKGRDNCEPLTKEEWDAHCTAACRHDWKALLGERLSEAQLAKVVIGGKAKKVQATSSFDVGVRVHAPAMESDSR